MKQPWYALTTNMEVQPLGLFKTWTEASNEALEKDLKPLDIFNEAAFQRLKQSIEDLTRKTVKLSLEDLNGEQLNWAAAVALGLAPTLLPSHCTKDALEVHDADLVDMEADTTRLDYLHDWTLTGPPIARFGVMVVSQSLGDYKANVAGRRAWLGATPQEAILKAVIHRQLGNEVEIPKELT